MESERLERKRKEIGEGKRWKGKDGNQSKRKAREGKSRGGERS